MARHRGNVVPFRRPFRAVPLRAVVNRPRRPRGKFGITAIMVALPLATFTAVFLFGIPGAGGVTLPAPHRAAAHDSETAYFDRCNGPVRVNCVVDGDTFWYGGEKIRIADINAPEVSEPDCASEAALGARATDRLLALLNQGPFTLAANNDGSGRAYDKYGRSLRVVTRAGASLGETLVDEGLAEEWKGYRGSWC
uniref:thermonuclease family protein n=1 Tax=Altererythrobacter segetis TaxID=1104773 RepID=UPI001FB01D35|nr:thermonuclease family protein [Altererythrobacter segetis]